MTPPLLLANHFQVAYVVRDMDKAIAAMGDKFGLARWQVLAMPQGAPAFRLGFARAQHLLVELVEADPEQKSIFRRWLPDTGSAARFHHLGYLVESEAEFEVAMGQFATSGVRTFRGSSADLYDFAYADTVAELGHYCELVHLRPAGKDFFSGAPQN
jgi:hypothetical protein